jgi:thiamine-monophosphate kinase
MLYGGEDYVLLGTVQEALQEKLASLFRKNGLPFYVIGTTESGEPGVEMIPAEAGGIGKDSVKRDGNGYREQRRTLHKKGYNHFER